MQLVIVHWVGIHVTKLYVPIALGYYLVPNVY